MKATIFYCNHTYESNVMPADGEAFKLAECQELLRHKFLEVHNLGNGRVMVSVEALFDDNGIADTAINGAATWHARKKGVIADDGYIYGAVMICDSGLVQF